MKPTETLEKTQKKSSARTNIIRSIFSVLCRIAGAFLVGFLIYSFLNENYAPTSSELLSAPVESSIYLSVSPENGPECMILSEENLFNATASLFVEADGKSFHSNAFSAHLTVNADDPLTLPFDPSVLGYYSSTDFSSPCIEAKELASILPSGAAARIELSVDKKPILRSDPFFLIPFLTGGTYGE